MKINFYKFLDKSIGFFLVYLMFILNFLFPKHKKVKKILVIKLWALGDSVVLIPLIHALKGNYPNSKIDILVRKRNKDIFKYNEDINKIHLYELKHYFKLFFSFKKYDLVFDAEPYLNISALLSFWLGKTTIGFNNQHRSIIYDHKIPHKKDAHMVQNYLNMIRALDITTEYEELIQINSSEQDKKSIKEFLKLLGKKTVGFCVGTAESASKTRLWNYNNWAVLGDELTKKGYQVVFIGSNNEKKQIDKIIEIMQSDAINFAGTLSLLQTCELIKHLNLFISIDTGPMHIAAAQGVKTIGLFGPNTPTLWAPYGKNNISIYKNLPCSPCIINDKGHMPDCLRKTDKYACMKQISVEDVLRYV